MFSYLFETIHQDNNFRARNGSLHFAVQKGVQEVQLMIDQNVDINSRENNFDLTPLHFAIEGENKEIVEMLLSYGAKIDSMTCQNNVTPLQRAVTKGNFDITNLLLTNGADANLSSKCGISPLHIVAENGNFEIAKLLLQYNVKVNVACNCVAAWGEGVTPLHLAADKGNRSIIKLLLNSGADVNSKTIKSSTVPLHLATLNEDIKTCKLLIANGGNVNAANSELETPFHMAVRLQSQDIIELFLHDNKADVNVCDKLGRSALHLALLDSFKATFYSVRCSNNKRFLRIHMCDAEIVKLILNNGADINKKQSNGLTALHLAIKEKYVNAVELLLDFKANVHSRSEDGKTPFFMAADVGCTRSLKLLLKHKADVNSGIYTGVTPLHIACYKGHTRFVEILLECNVEVNSINKAGETPLHVAVQKGHIDIVRLLLKNKADKNCIIKSGGWSPLLFAIVRGYTNIVKLLLMNNVDVNSKNSLGSTMIHSAIQYNNITVLRFLLECDADINMRDNLGRSPLRVAAFNADSEAVHILLDYDADINAVDNKGTTPLAFIIAYIYHLNNFNAGNNEDELKDNIAVAKRMTKQIVKRLSQKLHVSEENFYMVCANPELNTFREECEIEILRMREVKLSDNICFSFYDILVQDIHVLATYIFNNNDVTYSLERSDIKEMFPIYRDMLDHQIQRGFARRRCLKESSPFFYCTLKLPELLFNFVDKLCSHLSNKDLRNLTEIWKSHKDTLAVQQEIAVTPKM